MEASASRKRLADPAASGDEASNGDDTLVQPPGGHRLPRSEGSELEMPRERFFAQGGGESPDGELTGWERRLMELGAFYYRLEGADAGGGCRLVAQFEQAGLPPKRFERSAVGRRAEEAFAALVAELEGRESGPR